MKRRDFLNLTAGSALATMVPLPAGSTGAAVRAPKRLYVWAVAMAHAGNPISQATLSQALKVPSAEAAALMQRLVARGVVAAPNAAGIARATAPAFRSSAFLQSAKVVARQSAAGTGDMLKRVGKAVVQDASGQDTPPLDETPNDASETDVARG